MTYQCRLGEGLCSCAEYEQRTCANSRWVAPWAWFKTDVNGEPVAFTYSEDDARAWAERGFILTAVYRQDDFPFPVAITGVLCHCGKDGHALNSVNCPVHGNELRHRIPSQLCIKKAFGGGWCVGRCRDPRDCSAEPATAVTSQERT